MSGIEVTRGYTPGSLGRVASLHGSYYQEHWGFGLFFEAQVASELGEFLKTYDSARDGFWTVGVDGRIEGSIAIDGARADTDGAHLRWLIVSDALRGQGAGGTLIKTALDFCRESGCSRVYLWTFAGLNAAKHLYAREGFELAEEHHGSRWGSDVLEQKYECNLR